MQVIHIITALFADPFCGPDTTRRHPEAPRMRKSIFYHKLLLARFAKMCFLYGRRALFQKLRLLLLCAGLVGPKSEHVGNILVLKLFLGVKGATSNSEPAPRERAGPVFARKSKQKASKKKKHELLDIRWQA